MCVGVEFCDGNRLLCIGILIISNKIIEQIEQGEQHGKTFFLYIGICRRRPS
jgi:hypothetical protein